MTKKQTSDDSTAGVGPGVTGASGDLIEGTGSGQGVGGTGESGMSDAAGQRPDERQNPGPQDLANASPDQAEGATTTRLPGSATGTIGGGGPDAVRTDEDAPGLPGEGAGSHVPGGTRNVGPANDRDASGARAHSGSERAEPQEKDRQGPREGGRDR